MADFHVSVPDLRRKSASLAEAADLIRGIRSSTGPVEDCDAGPDDLCSACTEFGDALVRSLELLAEQLAESAENLKTSAQRYEQSDASGEEGFARIMPDTGLSVPGLLDRLPTNLTTTGGSAGSIGLRSVLDGEGDR
ncbi:hypothetical protein C3Y87_20380 [Carbonactinospora thermoautotrophica]|uniref:Uncharacterized protein n=1 Tax=Carbonactinospora thermoautotrophica TaxID=1469144 RepID=A0A132NFR0_9ACTN|nr:hypothetical protein [Carbonactinospora thermoautotrophica]KWX04985.1 hypothetical protein TH66_04230 [Carbonactinospora thermoautotrophica]KWX08941.1 hypothetical protein TR74_12610 [Carbonactinospora thermoautotrophica]MCX9193695.1 hypothetical protein [Carbonactinospora thermoautotrophica]